MRVDTKKFLFMGMKSDKEIFFEKAQDLGVIQFEDMHPHGFHEISPDVEMTLQAIKVLRGLAPVPQEETDEYAIAEGLAYKITELKSQLDRLEEEERTLKLEIARVGVFGDFSLDDIAFIEREGKRVVQFYCAKPNLRLDEKVPQEALFIDSDQGLDYYVAINKLPTHFEDMIEMVVDRPIGKLKERLSVVKEDIYSVEQRIKTYAKYNTFLHKAYVYKMDAYNLKTNQHYADSKMEGELFAVVGWVPITKLDIMEQLVSSCKVVVDEIAIEEEDVAPTSLENVGFHRVGEDLVHIYDTPSNTDKDPSMWILIWFSLFFAMIIGDAGYGLLFLGTAFYLRYKFGPMQSVGKRVWTLLVVVSLSCVGWGVLTNSFFGMQFSPDNPVREYSVLNWLSEKKMTYHIENKTKAYKEVIAKYPDLKGATKASEFFNKGIKERNGEVIHELADNTSNGIMMEIALLVGMIHICCSFGRYAGRNLAGIGWIMAIIGGFLYVPVYLDTPSILNYVFGLNLASSGHDGIYLMIGGFTLALSLSIYQNKLMGIFEVATVIQIFADILSYLRLYALGLAGGIVSATINGFAIKAGPILAIFPIVIGHFVNILLSIMGGVIHGLRLNFLEWYHYCFEGGGKRYDPLRKLSKEQ